MPVTKIEALCPAKVNLTFDIKGLRPDGYHEVESLLQAVSLYDRLSFSYQSGEPFLVRIKSTKPEYPEFPLGKDNIIYTAVSAFRQYLPGQAADFELEVRAEKNIPAGAGLGGGSSNAAATLMVLNTVFNEPFSADKLAMIGRELGADVPFFIAGGVCLGTARGDELQPKSLVGPLNKPVALWFVLVKPGKISVPSKWAYAEYDEYVRKHGTVGMPEPDWRSVFERLQQGNLQLQTVESRVGGRRDDGLRGQHSAGLLHNTGLGNVFEPVIFACYPELAELKRAVESAGAICCYMTGSGSALYGLAASEEHACSIADTLSLNTEIADLDIFIAQSIEHGVQMRGTNEEDYAAKC